MTEPKRISAADDSERDYSAMLTTMGDIFCALISDNYFGSFTDGETARSPACTDYVDLKIAGHWWRIKAEPILEPVSLEEHNRGL